MVFVAMSFVRAGWEFLGGRRSEVLKVGVAGVSEARRVRVLHVVHEVRAVCLALTLCTTCNARTSSERTARRAGVV